jgi:hypothetical protein
MYLVQYRRGIVFDPADGKKGILREMLRPIKSYNREKVARIIAHDKETYQTFQTADSMK